MSSGGGPERKTLNQLAIEIADLAWVWGTVTGLLSGGGTEHECHPRQKLVPVPS